MRIEDVIMNGEVIGVSRCEYMYECTLLLPIYIITKASGKFKLTYIDSSYGCLLKIIIRIWPCVFVSAEGGGPIGTGV